MHSRGADRRRDAQAPVSPERREGGDRRSQGYISRAALFDSIPYAVLEAVLAGCPVEACEAGAVLLSPGQANDAIHLLLEGRLRIHLEHADSGDFIPIEAGGCFGELSIIDGQPVSAWIVADRPSRVMRIPESVFWERLIPVPGVARNLLRVLAERMRANRDLIIERMKDSLALEHLHKELAIAQELQRSMLPAPELLFTGRPEVRAWAEMTPAKDVGGDFYDAFQVEPGLLFVAVGDVSGKGVPAALFMSRTITQLRMEAARERSPAAIVTAVNRALCQGNESGMFVTLFCGLLETASGRFDYCSAGHNPPVLLAGGAPEFVVPRKGLVAGIMEGARYAEDSKVLAPGHGVLLYTDGVTEAMDPGGGLYGEPRLISALSGDAGGDPRLLVDRVRMDLASFVQNAPQADDITLLALFRT